MIEEVLIVTGGMALGSLLLWGVIRIFEIIVSFEIMD